MAGPVPAIHVLRLRKASRGCPGRARAWRSRGDQATKKAPVETGAW